MFHVPSLIHMQKPHDARTAAFDRGEFETQRRRRRVFIDRAYLPHALLRCARER